MSYTTPDIFLGSYDVRKVAQELSDTGTALTLGEVPTSTVLQQVLDEASDLILAACQVGQRYAPEDLDALAASTSTGFLLRRINNDLAYGLLVSRRGRAATDINRLAPMYSVAHGYLNDLRSGILLFPKIDDSRPLAGQPKAADLATNPFAPVTWVQQTGMRIFPFGVSRPSGCDC